MADVTIPTSSFSNLLSPILNPIYNSFESWGSTCLWVGKSAVSLVANHYFAAGVIASVVTYGALTLLPGTTTKEIAFNNESREVPVIFGKAVKFIASIGAGAVASLVSAYLPQIISLAFAAAKWVLTMKLCLFNIGILTTVVPSVVFSLFMLTAFLVVFQEVAVRIQLLVNPPKIK